MNINVYLKKIYTVAFRLTGNKKAACELTSQAILKLSGKIDTNNKISDHIFKSAALEVCSLFWKKYDVCPDVPDFDCNLNDKTYEIQKTLLSLKPVSRIIIIWKDLLSFQLSDIAHIINKDITELNDELSCARMKLKQNLGMHILL